jgi:hypothetical protein
VIGTTARSGSYLLKCLVNFRFAGLISGCDNLELPFKSVVGEIFDLLFQLCLRNVLEDFDGETAELVGTGFGFRPDSRISDAIQEIMPGSRYSSKLRRITLP